MPRIPSVLFVVLPLILTLSGICGAEQPNFVLFIGDDHGVYHSSPYGAAEIETPHMQALADAGMKFERAYVASPSDDPSRAALFTGQMPIHNGIASNGETQFHRESRPLLKVLEDLGYDVALYGKVGPIPPGGNFTRIPYSQPAEDPAYQTQNLQDVSGFLNRRTDPKRPLALIVGSHQAHRPWPASTEVRIRLDEVRLPPKTYETREARVEFARYVEAVEQIDDQLGALRSLVQTYLDPANTVLIYSSDHGAAWPFAKWTLYETGIRTPLLAVWPGRIPAGQSAKAMVSWIDLLPTWIDLAGGTVPEGIDGQSFKTVLLGETDEHRERIFATHKGEEGINVFPTRSLRSAQWKYILNVYPDLLFTTNIDLMPDTSPNFHPQWSSWMEAAQSDPAAAAFIRSYHSRPKEELYRIEQDPFETKNLAEDPNFESILKAMRFEVKNRIYETRDDISISGLPRYLKNRELP